MDSKSIQRSSSSSSSTICKHDVFLSFRGKDTRNNFTDHLFDALQRKGIFTFRDDKKLKKGEPISSELLQAIEGSRIFIVILSKNYADSTWCLRELEKIIDFIEVPGRHVLPVFYKVDPSEVRRQSGDYGKAFAKYEQRFKEDLEIVKRWRVALTQVANLSGWDVRDNNSEAGAIANIVEDLTNRLDRRLSSFRDDLVGIHSRVEQLEKLLVLDSNDDVRIIGICGMGGIGKTTITTVLYDKVSHQFGARCFIDNISKIYGDHGPIGAQKQLLCQTLNQGNLEICNLPMATSMIRTRLRHIRILIVLDNVDQVEQLEKLMLNRECLGVGSRIIIISRDEHILRKYGVDEVYPVQLLNWDDAGQLFCRKAFKCDNIMKGYQDLVCDILSYADGHPLALEVLGSFLFGRNVDEWKSALDRLRESPSRKILDVLQISYDGLDEMEREIFLDIACFFHGESEDYVKRVLDCCGFHPNIGIRVLIDKSLITIYYGLISMHDLLRELGRKIAQENSPKEPGKWSRLWDHKDLSKIRLENAVIENPKAIVLQYKRMTTLEIGVGILSKMNCLRLLIFKNAKFLARFNCLSSELQYLEWHACPLKYWPLNFHLDKLVELILPYSNIKQLWKDIKPLPNLRIMNLSYSKDLIKMSDFKVVPNLEQLNLEGCTKLIQISPSIGHLRKLVNLNLKNCTSLVSLPSSIFGPSSLEDPNLEQLNLEGCTKLVQINPSIGHLRKLVRLNLKNCISLVSLPSSILGLSSLEVLNLSGCSKLFNHEHLEKPRHMKRLKLDISEGTIQCQSTSSIWKRLLISLPFRFFSSKRHEDSAGLLSPTLSCLIDLNLSFCNLFQIPDAVMRLHCLERLNLRGNHFGTLPHSIIELPKLRTLDLVHCEQLKYLPECPSSTILPVRREPFHGSYFSSGLYMYNCPKLSENERCSSMAFSWIIKVLQGLEGFRPHGRIDVVIPGTQIPRWFENQNVGKSISIEPSPIVHDSNWIGFACCALFVTHDDSTNDLDDMDHDSTYYPYNRDPCFYFLFRNGQHSKGPIILELDKEDLVTDELDHLFLHFISREEFIWYTSRLREEESEGDILLSAYVNRQYRGLRHEVRNMGWRWVFKQDLEELQSNPTMMPSNDFKGDGAVLSLESRN